MTEQPKYEETTAAELKQGDAVLVKFYDTSGDYVEEDWIASKVTHRNYGAGIRVFVTWTAPGGVLEDAYPGSKVFGRRVGVSATRANGWLV